MDITAVTIIFLIALCCATYTDIKKREIPIWLFPTAGILSIPFFLKHITLWDILGAACVFLLFVLLSVKTGTGGGDIIMMTVISFVFGVSFTMRICLLLAILVAVAFFIYYLVAKKKPQKEDNFPMAPFVLAAFVLSIIF